MAAFRDIKIDLTDGAFLTNEEKGGQSTFSFGMVIGDNGTQTRVAADDATANIVLNGKFHSNEHGWGNFSATVAVEGPVKISMGSCAWGGDVTIKDGTGTTVGTFNTNNGSCYHNDKENNIVSAYYKGTETTLTISGGNYTPYFAVEAVDIADIPSDVNITYVLGDTQAEGTVPAAETVEIGNSYTIPANYTLYAEGKTLTAWSDGTNTYKPGETITAATALELTPVFTDNTVSLADRTEAVTLKWNFRRDQGAPILNYEGKSGFLVAQAVVNGSTIDVKTPFTTSPGKINNTNNTDWCQVNNGTTFTVPSCNGAVVSMESYTAFGTDGKTATTIDGQSDYTSAKTISYTIAGTAETINIVIGNDAGYLRYIQVVLPVVQTTAGKTYTDEPVTVTWAMNNADNPEAYTKTPEDAFSTVAFDPGTAILNPDKKTANITDGNAQVVTTGLNYQPATGSSDVLTWSVKPAKGLTFKPTKLTGYVNRDGTDSQNGITISAKMGDGTVQTLGTWTALRSGKTSAHQSYDATAIYQYNIELTEAQQTALSGAETFYLTSTIGVGTAKSGIFGEVTITGTVSGTIADVPKYTLTTKANPEAGGTVSAYPKSDVYEEDTEVQLTAEQNFGYHFVNWTDADGNEVSTEAKFKYTVTDNAELTANFEAVNTYELAYGVEGGANLYMVQPVPAPTVINGKNMYEEGTTVTLTASNNKILNFTNWSDGTSNSEIVLNMTENKSVTAAYSAIDFIAGWDFYKTGNNGRKADFAALDNDADAFNLVNEDNSETSGWLDKSQEAAGGYEGKPAAVNWRTGTANGDVGHYYWQTMVNAAAFTDIKVSFEMLYNYNSYTTYNVAYSTDGTEWNDVGSVTMEGAKAWTPCEISLPEDADNQETLYIRWYADKTSPIAGTASANDGNAISNVFILGTENATPDPIAPTLVSSVPAEGAENSSSTGKIVLTFDKRVNISENATATLNGLTLTPVVFGKTVTFQYKNLDYATGYVFTLPANCITNQTGVPYEQAITINFKTMAKPEVAKAVYDFIVPDDGAFEEAIAAADSRTDKTKRFRIFVKQGTYKLPQSTTATIVCDNGQTYPSPVTNINSSNISIIGEEIDATVVTNTITGETYNNASVYEKIGNSDVLQIQGSVSGLYFQDITIKSAIGDALGRNIAIQDKGTRNIYKNVCLYGYQDTWVTNKNDGLYYFEGGKLRGRTDFLCGKGDVFYNAVDLIMCQEGGYLAVPSQSLKYGYVFKDCTIKGEKDGVDGNYTLGRPWGDGTPSALYINTKMEAQPSAIGWAEMGTGWPARFAEYNSMTSKGTVISLNDRKKTFGGTHSNNPVLTEEEAAEAGEMSNMFGDWQPTLYTEQAPVPSNVTIENSTLTWDDSNYVLCWAICKDGKVVGFTTEPTYTVDDATVTWSVRAANEMGGLGEATVATEATGINEVGAETGDVVNTMYYNLQGVRVSKDFNGVVIKIDTMKDGKQVSTKIVK